ncbi:MAG: transposase [Bradyrhizobiaceae bacterium]|nr:transposase [Bradyrhizobiaceae bacterium]
MTHHHRSPDPSPSPATAAIVPPAIVSLMAAFRDFFTAPVWDHVLVLVTGAVLTTGKRTVSAVLRIMGLAEAADFALYHHVLSQAHWDSRIIARKLLSLILDRLLPTGPVIIGIDDTIERRWGPKIAARGIYRDPVRSTHGHFVKASGLRWLSFMVMIPLPWATRRWALPFLTILAPSQRYDDTHHRRHKTLTDWARQGILQVRRWLPNRLIIIVADSSFAAIELIAAVRRHVCFVTRLRLDANLFEPPPARPPGKRGRTPKRGRKLPKLTEVFADPATVWTRITMPEWYGGKRCRLEFTSGTAIWYSSGLPPLPIRWVLVRDPAGIRKPQSFLCTNLDAEPKAILGWYVHRWSVETTFEETRTHLGVETQRQWSDLAIARTTPALLGLFSLITLWAAEAKAALHPRFTAWYAKEEPTFSDAIATVRRVLWAFPNFSISRKRPDNVEIPGALLQRLMEAVCFAT